MPTAPQAAAQRTALCILGQEIVPDAYWSPLWFAAPLLVRWESISAGDQSSLGTAGG